MTGMVSLPADFITEVNVDIMDGRTDSKNMDAKVITKVSLLVRLIKNVNYKKLGGS